MSTTQVEDVAALAPDLPAQSEVSSSVAFPGARLAWYSVVMISLVTLCGQLDYGLMPLLVQPIERSTHMSDTQVAWLMGWAYSIPYLLCGFPLGRVSDRLRRTFVLSGAMTVWSIGTALCALAAAPARLTGFVGTLISPFGLCRGLMGGAISVKGPTTVSLMPDIVPRDKLGRAFGVYNICLYGGQALSTICGGIVLAVFLHRMPVHIFGIEVKQAWQMVFLCMGLPGLFVAAIVALTVPEPSRHGRERKESAPLLEVAKFLLVGPAAKVYVPLIIGAVMGGILIGGYGSWRAAFFDRAYHMGAHVYGPLSGTLSLIAAPIGVVIGVWIADRMQRRWVDTNLRLPLAVHILTMPIYILTPLMPNAALALGLQFVGSILLMVSAPSQLAAMQIITPNAMRAQVNAIYMITISFIGNGLGPEIVAFMTDFIFHSRGHLGTSMILLAAVTTPVSLVCMWMVVKPYGRIFQQIQDAEAGKA